MAASIYTKYWSILVRHATIELNGDIDEAEELVGSVLAKIVQQELKLPKDTLSHLSFVKGVIRNHAKHTLRDWRRLVSLGDCEHVASLPMIRTELAVGRSRPEAILAQMLSGLTEAERSVIRQHYLEGRSVSEIAQLRGCTRKTVKELVRRGRRKLVLVPYESAALDASAT